MYTIEQSEFNTKFEAKYSGIKAVWSQHCGVVIWSKSKNEYCLVKEDDRGRLIELFPPMAFYHRNI
ncbi:MAG: hypothetical protein V4469_03030 [Patescibacteria group bacterium]